MLFAIKLNLHIVQCILCGQYILADIFLRNSGYLFEREVLSTFGCQFPLFVVLMTVNILNKKYN